MRSDLKLMYFGFFAGLGIGAFALTSVSASIETASTRGDRAAVTGRVLTYDESLRGESAPSKRGSDAAGRVEYFDTRGALVYRSDPSTTTTSVAKGVIVPATGDVGRAQIETRPLRHDPLPERQVDLTN